MIVSIAGIIDLVALQTAGDLQLLSIILDRCRRSGAEMSERQNHE
jgi:hypothetical protein